MKKALFKAVFNQDVKTMITLLEAKANPNLAYSSTCPLTKKGDHCTCLGIILVLTTGYNTTSGPRTHLDKKKYPECRDFHLPNGQMLTFLVQRAFLSNSYFEGSFPESSGTQKRFSQWKDLQMLDLLLYYGSTINYSIKHPRNFKSFPTSPKRLQVSRTWPKYDAPCSFLEYSNQANLPFSLKKWQTINRSITNICRDGQMLIREYIGLEQLYTWYKLSRGHVEIQTCYKCNRESIGVSNCKKLPVCNCDKRCYPDMCDCGCEDCCSMDGMGQKGCDVCEENDFLYHRWR